MKKAEFTKVGKLNAKIQVSDGIGTRLVTITSRESFVEVLEKIANTMKRPNSTVELGYEAPWSSKNGSKKCISYISNQNDLNEFWLAAGRYTTKQTGKKNAGDPNVVEGVVIHNMVDVIQVSRKWTPPFNV